MESTQLKQIVEAALFSAGEPLSLDRLQGLFEEAERPSKGTLREQVEALQQDYAERGIELVEVASGYRFQAVQPVANWVARLWDERPARYSRALLETLALIAYRQPITRAEIEDIRGVSVSSNIMKTLQERSWVRVVGHRDVPGRPAMYATTREFLDYFNLKGLDDLPTLAELRDIDKINEELDLRDPGSSANDTEPEGESAEYAPADEASAEVEPEIEVTVESDETPESPEGAELVELPHKP